MAGSPPAFVISPTAELRSVLHVVQGRRAGCASFNCRTCRIVPEKQPSSNIVSVNQRADIRDAASPVIFTQRGRIAIRRWIELTARKE